MKTFKNIFAILLITLFAFSCTPNAIDQDDTANLETETFATGGNGSSSTDDGRD